MYIMYVCIYIVYMLPEQKTRLIIIRKVIGKKTKIIIYNNMAYAAVGGCEPTKLRVTAE